MSIKIQINSAEALERLIGGDTELEIEIRNSIVQNFTRKHLKSLVNHDIMLNVRKAVSEEIKEQFFDELKVGNWGKTITTFKKEDFEDLKKFLRAEANRELRTLVKKVVQEHKSIDKINEKVEDSVNWIEKNLQEAILSERINALVDKKIKEKLGL
jgi:N12 class adenine-specific DNA methylase